MNFQTVHPRCVCIYIYIYIYIYVLYIYIYIYKTSLMKCRKTVAYTTNLFIELNVQ